MKYLLPLAIYFSTAALAAPVHNGILKREELNGVDPRSFLPRPPILGNLANDVGNTVKDVGKDTKNILDDIAHDVLVGRGISHEPRAREENDVLKNTEKTLENALNNVNEALTTGDPKDIIDIVGGVINDVDKIANGLVGTT